MGERLKAWLGVGFFVASLDVAAVLLRSSPASTGEIAALVVCAAVEYGLLAILGFGVLLGGFSERVPSIRQNRGWYAAAGALLVIAVALAPPRSRIANRSDAPAAAGGSQPNILLISIDTLRRDHLGCYGYEEARTPHIDALAKQSVLFEDATSSTSLTGPSHTTMLTGKYPVTHGVEDNGVPIGTETTTIADALRAAGYRTAAFVSGWTLKDRAVDLAPRFEHYDDQLNCSPFVPEVLDELAIQRAGLLAVEKLTGYRFLHNERLGELTTARAAAWLAEGSERPFFALVHYFDTHGPHVPPSRSEVHLTPAPAFDYFAKPAVQREVISDPAKVRNAIRAYDDEISYVDREVGSLLEQLERLPGGKNTVVIFTADHGESLTEHGWYFDHGEYLYETCIRVPLMMRLPDGRHAGTRRREQVRHVDVAPTIAELAGITNAAGFEGETLLGIVDGTESGARTSFGSIRQGSKESSRARYYVRSRRYKLIWNFDHRETLWKRPAYEEIYDLASDPNEEHNLIATPPPILDELRAQMESRIPDERRHVASPDEGVRARLRALGYQ